MARWCSSSRALATLGLFVNRQNRRQLGRYVKTRVFISEALAKGPGADPTAAFVRDPEGFDARGYGDAWLRGRESCVLRAPSRVVPEEANDLVNPPHPDFGGVTATTEPYVADPRLLT